MSSGLIIFLALGAPFIIGLTIRVYRARKARKALRVRSRARR